MIPRRSWRDILGWILRIFKRAWFTPIELKVCAKRFRMTQQVTITTESDLAMRPLVEAAIQNEKKLVMHGIGRTEERLAEFEKMFGMSSKDFAQRFFAGELEESLDFIEWSMEIRALQLLQEQYQALNEARVD
jgi:hypothetical protein